MLFPNQTVNIYLFSGYNRYLIFFNINRSYGGTFPQDY